MNSRSLTVLTILVLLAHLLPPASIITAAATSQPAQGRTVLEQPQLDDGTLLSEGTISLQAESHPVEFRKVEILLLEE